MFVNWHYVCGNEMNDTINLSVMNLRLLILPALILLPLQFLAQSAITGTIREKDSNEPIEFAMVYVDGSTMGTLSDSLGNFHLKNIHFPCTLVVSHLSYITQTVNLNDSLTTTVDFLVEFKINNLDQVSVQDKNLREENLQLFREKFLGDNVWGKYATIENEDAIQFSKEYLTTETTALRANSTQPLKIELPLLGYTVYLDLIEFKWQPLSDFNQEICTIKGYSYFLEHAYDSKRDSIRINKNRDKNYYNSAHHFCRSLFQNKLHENGYKLYEINENLVLSNFKELDPEKYIHGKGKYAEVTELDSKKLFLSYHDDRHGKPRNLNKHKAVYPTESQIIFKEDTCIIRDNGTIPGNTIVFGPPIGSKKVGSLLPDDYQPIGKR